MKYFVSTLTFLLFSISINGQALQNELVKLHPYGTAYEGAPPEFMDWEPLIGTCQCRSVQRNADGSWKDTIDMTWVWKYILEGKAVQDYSLKSDGFHSTSIRQYNPDSSQWYVTFFGTASPSATPGTWKGGKIDEDIVLKKPQKAPNGMEGFYKITFSNITGKGFNWLGEWVDATGNIHYPTWKILCKKLE